MSSSRTKLSFLPYALLGLVIMLSLAATSGWRKFDVLSSQGLKAVGTITAKEPQNHQSLRYEYVVNGQTHQGLESLGSKSVGSAFSAINVGDKVQVIYLPTQADTSCLCDPAKLLVSETVFILLPAILAPAFLFFVNNIRRKRSISKSEYSSHQ